LLLRANLLLKSLHTQRSQHLRAELRAAREAASITQQDLAQRLGVPQSFVSKYESGERRLDVIELLEVCEALGLDVAALLRGLVAVPPAAERRGAGRTK